LLAAEEKIFSNRSLFGTVASIDLAGLYCESAWGEISVSYRYSLRQEPIGSIHEA
jgi:hypothetical protein